MTGGPAPTGGPGPTGGPRAAEGAADAEDKACAVCMSQPPAGPPPARACPRSPECRGNAGVCPACEARLGICVLCRSPLPPSGAHGPPGGAGDADGLSGARGGAAEGWAVRAALDLAFVLILAARLAALATPFGPNIFDE